MLDIGNAKTGSIVAILKAANLGFMWIILNRKGIMGHIVLG